MAKSSKSKSGGKSLPKPKSKSKSKPGTKPVNAKDAKPKGDNVRMLAGKPAVNAFIKGIIAAKASTSEVGQNVSTATKRAQDAGVNIPAARIAARIYSMALRDGAKARVLWDDVEYYLTECTDFDNIAPVGLFDPSETRSTKAGGKGGKSRSKKSEPKQADLSERADLSMAEGAAANGAAGENVHSLDDHRDNAPDDGGAKTAAA